jgi:hypothetical protein
LNELGTRPAETHFIVHLESHLNKNPPNSNETHKNMVFFFYKV